MGEDEKKERDNKKLISSQEFLLSIYQTKFK